MAGENECAKPREPARGGGHVNSFDLVDVEQKGGRVGMFEEEEKVMKESLL